MCQMVTLANVNKFLHLIVVCDHKYALKKEIMIDD